MRSFETRFAITMHLSIYLSSYLSICVRTYLSRLVSAFMRVFGMSPHTPRLKVPLA